MTYFLGIFGFIGGFYAGLLMLKPALRKYSQQELRTNKALAKRVGWIPWLMALIGMGIGIYGYDWVMRL